jgi:hypothetical protein
LPLFANSFATVPGDTECGNGTVEGDASRRTMFKRPTKFGFATPTPDAHPPQGTLPVLIATISLGLSIAVVLTAVTLNAARAAQLF